MGDVIKPGDWKWSSTLVQLEDLAILRADRIACARKHRPRGRGP